jgi:hypothetical protein
MASSKVIESRKNSSKVASGNVNELRRFGEAGKKALIWATGCILETSSGGGVAPRVGVQQLMYGGVSVYRLKRLNMDVVQSAHLQPGLVGKYSQFPKSFSFFCSVRSFLHPRDTLLLEIHFPCLRLYALLVSVI